VEYGRIRLTKWDSVGYGAEKIEADRSMNDIEEVLQWADNVIVAKDGEPLTPIQEAILKGVWQRQKYPQIAQDYNCSESHIKKEASKLWEKLRDELGDDLNKFNFRSKVEKKHRVSQCSQSGHCLQIDSVNIGGQFIQNIKDVRERSPSSPNSPDTQSHSPIIDLTDAPEITEFYDRIPELTTLQQWILEENTRLITIYGLRGIGKSSLAIKLIETIHPKFDYIIWKSLVNIPKLLTIKNQLKHFFNPSQTTPPPTAIDNFRNGRCLLILDDLQNLFASGQLSGEYLTDYQDYGTFFQQIARNNHHSCVILLS